MGRREKEGGKKRQKELAKYAIISGGPGPSFFQDKEIHLDLHQTAAAMVTSRGVENKIMLLALYMQYRLSETRDPTA